MSEAVPQMEQMSHDIAAVTLFFLLYARFEWFSFKAANLSFLPRSPKDWKKGDSGVLGEGV
jgi:hypothetical protein